MSTIQNYIFEAFVNFVESGLFLYFISRKLIPKKQYSEKMKIIYAASALMLTSIIIFINEIKINGTYGVLIFLVLQGVFTFWVMEGEAAEKLLWGGIYITADLSADVMAFFVSGIITSQRADVLMFKYPYRFVVGIAYIIILTAYIGMLCKIKKQEIKMPKQALYIYTASIILAVIIAQVMLGACIEYPHILHTEMLYGTYAVTILILAIVAISIIFFMKFGDSYEKNIKLAKEKKIEQKNREKLEQTVNKLIQQEEKYYYFKANGTTHKAEIKKIKYLTSDLRMTKIVMENEKEYEFYAKLDEVYENIKDIHPAIKRANKSCAVNIEYAEKINAKRILIDNIEILISRKYQGDFKEYNIITEKRTKN